MAGDAVIEVPIVGMQPAPSAARIVPRDPMAGEDVPAFKVTVRSAFCFVTETAQRVLGERFPAHFLSPTQTRLS